MKRLLLLRHAKAVPSGPHIDDRARELSARGRRDAPGMGNYMSQRGLEVELVLSSPAKRTLETAKLVFGQFEKKPPTELVEALYLAQAEGILAVLRGSARSQQSICIVGHNPGLEVFAGVVARGPVWKQER
ncbi:MAG: histidine phosphatase family protein, partial [Alphaproteobacteria bacterium]|nr:histidine phosphatase family protein [Alphaproteobacteria bacterium]